MLINIINVDYLNETHAKDLKCLLDSYASDPMGGGNPLSKAVKKNIVPALSALPYAFSFICYVDELPVGFVNCFEAFSTFKCKPLINIHDVFVEKNFRGHGLSQKLLKSVEDEAKARDCCKITLEVLSGNNAAKKSYQSFGFSPYELDPMVGSALFWEKVI